MVLRVLLDAWVLTEAASVGELLCESFDGIPSRTPIGHEGPFPGSVASNSGEEEKGITDQYRRLPVIVDSRLYKILAPGARRVFAVPSTRVRARVYVPIEKTSKSLVHNSATLTV